MAQGQLTIKILQLLRAVKLQLKKRFHHDTLKSKGSKRSQCKLVEQMITRGLLLRMESTNGEK